MVDPTFLGGPRARADSSPDTPYVYLGIPYGPPYEPQDLTVCAGAADAVRVMSHRMEYAKLASHYDFDLGRELFAAGEELVTDLGNLSSDVRHPDAIADEASKTIRSHVVAGRIPLVIGGLDSIPPMVVRAFDGVETVNVLHVDAHLDFREDVDGVRFGYSSPIRRIRELACVQEIVQVGLRAVGTARPSDVKDALASGNNLVTAWELHEGGVPAFIQSLPSDHRWIVTIDCDGLDPSIAPAVGWPEPGGVTFTEIRQILAHLAKASAIAGVVFTEFRPEMTGADMTAQTIARLLINVIGLQR
nr:arginase family protein [Mycobacterium sp. DL99]